MLSSTSNIVVHLAPAPVVARVPHVTASGRDRPEVSLARELAIVGHLADRGIPTTPPSRELPPGPHRIAGHRWASFVEHVELAPVADDDAARVGESLVEVIDAMAGLADPAGQFDRSLAAEADVSLALLEGRIDEGCTTVGLSVQLDHLQPVAVGNEVSAKANLDRIEGRRLVFTVAARDERGLVAAGKLTRVIVNVERFLEKTR